MEGDEETEDLIVMREQRRQLRERLAGQRKARLELMNSLQNLVPELVSSLELSLKVVSSFSGKESHSPHSSGKQNVSLQLEGLPLPPDSSLPGLPASLSTPRSSKPDPTSVQHGRVDSEAVRMAAPAGKTEEKWNLDKDFGGDNKEPDAALAVVKKLIASCLLSSSTSVPIDSAGLHRRLPKDLSSTEKSALLEIGGDRGGIAAVEAALQAFADDNASVDLEEFVVSGKNRLMVLGIDRNRLAKELPATSSQAKTTDELAHNSGAIGMEMSGGSLALSPLPARSTDVWGLGGDIHMHVPPLPGSGPHMYPGGGAPPMMGSRVGPRMIGMHGIAPTLPGMGLGYGGMPGNMQRPAPGAPQVPAVGGKVRGNTEEEVAKDLEAMLAKKSFRELQKSKTGEELLDLLHRPTAKETAVAEKFKTKGGSVLKEYCPNLTKEDCRLQRNSYIACEKVHFRRIIAVHTDVNLGDCSFLDTCRHMKTCKYVHYELDPTPDVPGIGPGMPPRKPLSKISRAEYCSEVELGEPQWINCDIRTFRMDILGQFGVIMADPPWDIHMELPYGTMADDEMRSLNVPALQTNGLIFLWVTGRAMELGRECLELWGYRRVEELIWVKTNQLQRIIRTGRTGHWLNHSKEHCLVGIKGQPEVNRNIDTDVLVAEVRETSRKPDEMYPMLERISPRTRKLELFARMHNTHAGWISLGNQLNGVRLVDGGLRARFKAAYPDVEIQPPDPPTKSEQDQGGLASQAGIAASGSMENLPGMPAENNDSSLPKDM